MEKQQRPMKLNYHHLLALFVLWPSNLISCSALFHLFALQGSSARAVKDLIVVAVVVMIAQQ